MANLRRILLVEDDEAILETLKEFLEDEGYTIHTACNGLEALQFLRSENNPTPSLILLDLRMPVMDGFEFRKEQALDSKISKIPVVIMTADGQVESKKQQLAANGFVKKPIEIQSFLEEIKQFFT